MGCIACGRDLHSECLQDPCCCRSKESEQDFQPEEKNLGRPRQEVIGVSAGRKRAAADFQIIPEKPCEWRWLANCGGGVEPIIGCNSGLQEHRHHGPVKDTSCNEPHNVHRICTTCHNRWHAKNDEIYNEELYRTLPHQPRPATVEELLMSGAS